MKLCFEEEQNSWLKLNLEMRHLLNMSSRIFISMKLNLKQKFQLTLIKLQKMFDQDY